MDGRSTDIPYMVGGPAPTSGKCIKPQQEKGALEPFPLVVMHTSLFAPSSTESNAETSMIGSRASSPGPRAPSLSLPMRIGRASRQSLVTSGLSPTAAALTDDEDTLRFLTPEPFDDLPYILMPRGRAAPKQPIGMAHNHDDAIQYRKRPSQGSGSSHGQSWISQWIAGQNEQEQQFRRHQVRRKAQLLEKRLGGSQDPPTCKPHVQRPISAVECHPVQCW